MMKTSKKICTLTALYFLVYQGHNDHTVKLYSTSTNLYFQIVKKKKRKRKKMFFVTKRQILCFFLTASVFCKSFWRKIVQLLCLLYVPVIYYCSFFFSFSQWLGTVSSCSIWVISNGRFSPIPGVVRKESLQGLVKEMKCMRLLKMIHRLIIEISKNNLITRNAKPD